MRTRIIYCQALRAVVPMICVNVCLTFTLALQRNVIFRGPKFCLVLYFLVEAWQLALFTAWMTTRTRGKSHQAWAYRIHIHPYTRTCTYDHANVVYNPPPSMLELILGFPPTLEGFIMNSPKVSDCNVWGLIAVTALVTYICNSSQSLTNQMFSVTIMVIK